MTVETIKSNNKAEEPKIESGKSNENLVEYDDLISSAGEFGLYQILLFFSTAIFYLFGVFVYYSQLFITQVSPNHWCWIPELENLTDIERRTVGIPLDDESRYGYSRCEAYAANWSEVLANGLKPNESWTKTTCQYGWEFNKTEIPYPTISSDMGWVCEKDSYQASAQGIFFCGSVIGGILIGSIADRFGRLSALVTSNMIACTGGIISAFSRNFMEFSICRFFVGMASDTCMTIAFLLVMEYVSPNYRTLASCLAFALFYSSSVTTLPWLVLACGHWKTIALATSIPLAMSLLVPFVIPESPMWLLSRGRIDDAIKKILSISRVNRKTIPESQIENFRLSVLNRKKEESATLIDVLRRPILRNTFLKVCLIYSCTAVVFDALVRSIGQLNFNFFVSFSVISFTECPSLMITAFIMDSTGRRLLSVTVLTIGAVFCVLTAFVGSGLPSVLCALVARFAMNMAYQAGQQWGPEVLPTSVRATGAATIHIVATVFMILSPYIIYLETYIHWLPLVLVGCIAGVGAVTALTLPETAKKDLPQTFEDAEMLVTSQKLLSFSFFGNKQTKIDGIKNDGFQI